MGDSIASESGPSTSPSRRAFEVTVSFDSPVVPLAFFELCYPFLDYAGSRTVDMEANAERFTLQQPRDVEMHIGMVDIQETQGKFNPSKPSHSSLGLRIVKSSRLWQAARGHHIVGGAITDDTAVLASTFRVSPVYFNLISLTDLNYHI